MDSHGLTEEQMMIRDMVREFAEKEVKPIAAEIDEESRFPEETIRKMGELGLMGIPVPEAYGGAGGDNLSYIIAVEELSRVCGSTGITLAAHYSLGTSPILEFGTEEQKRRYLPDLATGRRMGSFGLTEPNAGSDAGGTQTTARLDGDHWILNGTKCFITNASVGEIFVVTAVTDRSKRKHGISAFIVEKGMPGFGVGKKENKLGLRGSDTCELVFEDARVPRENILGKEGEGFIQFLKTLDGGRISIGALSLGIAQGALDAAVEYAKNRKQFGKFLAQFQAIQFKIAEMATRIHASRLMIYHAARLEDAGEPFGTVSAMAKYYASDTAYYATKEAVQIHGGVGYSREFPVERYFRDAKLCEIGEGTSEIQKLVISRAFLR
jgi:butyryl-CoA dehydrogenase